MACLLTNFALAVGAGAKFESISFTSLFFHKIIPSTIGNF